MATPHDEENKLKKITTTRYLLNPTQIFTSKAPEMMRDLSIKLLILQKDTKDDFLTLPTKEAVAATAMKNTNKTTQEIRDLCDRR